MLHAVTAAAARAAFAAATHWDAQLRGGTGEGGGRPAPPTAGCCAEGARAAKPAAAVQESSAGSTAKGSGKAQTSKGGQPKGKGKAKGPPPTVAKDGHEAVLSYYNWVCRDHALSNSCTRRPCPRQHEALDAAAQAELRAALLLRKEAGGSSRDSSPATSPRSSTGSQSDEELREAELCFSFAKKGTCSRGDGCYWLHAESAAERRRVEEVHSRRKGKGKGKGGKADAAAALYMPEPEWDSY